MIIKGDAKLRGNCVGTDPDLFFDPSRGEDVARICSGCPVTTCLADARERGEETGWWRGTWLGLPAEPDDFLVVEPARVRVAIPSRHGTRGRYMSCTDGEDGRACPDCRSANAQYQNQYRHDGPAVTRPEIVDLQIPLFEGVSA